VFPRKAKVFSETCPPHPAASGRFPAAPEAVATGYECPLFSESPALTFDKVKFQGMMLSPLDID
jgi:hypothetical protein